jgi:hypothetical protein
MTIADRTNRIAATLLLLFAGTPVLAVGIGGGLSLDAGGSDWEIDLDSGPEIDADGGLVGAGCFFVLDTRPQGNDLFSYRFGAGWERYEGDFDFEDGPDDDIELSGFVTDHDFGFRVYSNQDLRLWVGPRVRFGFYSGELDDADADIDLVEFGIGPVFGANFKTGENSTIGASAGVRVSGYAGELDEGAFDDDVTGAGASVHFGAVFLWTPK